MDYFEVQLRILEFFNLYSFSIEDEWNANLSSLWKDLDDRKQKWDLLGVEGGDIDIILSRFERSGEPFSRACIEEFEEMLDMLELMDLSLVGDKWTWSD